MIRKLAVLTLTLLMTSQPLASAAERHSALADLTSVKARNTLALQEVEGQIRQLLSPSPELTLSTVINETAVESLQSRRHELLLRQQLYDRLLLQVDTRFKNGDLKSFLADRLVEMAKADLLTDPGERNLWKQMSFLSQALRDLPDRGEDVVAVVEAYLQKSNFLQPTKPGEFLQSRNYSNGKEAMAATPLTKEEVGDQVADRLDRLENSQAPSPTPQTN